MSSESGFGIGFDQVARHARACGYSLVLAHNADGRVAFVLSGPVGPAPDAAVIPAVQPRVGPAD